MMRDELAYLRLSGLRVLSGVIGIGVMVLAAATPWSGSGWAPLLIGVAIAVVPIGMVAAKRCDAATRIAFAGTLPLYPALMLSQATGSFWQIDIHMLFFVLLAMLAVLCDWKAIVTATIVIAVHHLGANLLTPAWVFPDGAHFGRVLFHAVTVLMEAGVLISLVIGLERGFAVRADAQAARAASEREAENVKQAQTALIVDSVGSGLSALAAGDLTHRIDADLDGPFAKLKSDFNAAMAAMGDAIGSVAEAASGITSGAGDIRQASDNLSQRTEQQAAALEETAAAMDEITSTVRETATGAAKANTAVAEARAEAEQSGEVVRRAVDAMGGIERSSAEISEIISVIDGIAFQTNLLALNAGVEAARAGDAGKGFAVVASEVRALAQRSAEAAKDVKTRITASGVQVEAGVELVSETGKALDRIIARIAEIATLIATIASSAEHQATGLQQVNTAVSEMDGVTQQNAAMVEEATAAARQLSEEAERLKREVTGFRLKPEAAYAVREPQPAMRARSRPVRQAA